jgi:2',3'-cyclic-nucleotide 2'-phosphodiesterase (5'-nucleotidase family)
LALGADKLKVAQKIANFPMLARNVLSIRGTWPKFPSFEIIEKGGLRIGVFGLTTPAAPSGMKN